jgi:DNA polymerase-1
MKDIKDLAEGLRENLIAADRKTVIRYQGVDADATISSWQGIKHKLHEDPALLNYYIHFTLPAMDLIRDISRNGCPIDRAKLADNIEETELELRRMSSEAIKLIPRKIKDMDKHRGKLKLSRRTLIADTLFQGYGLTPADEFKSKKTHEPSTCAEQLKMFSKNKFALSMIDYNKLYKVFTSYLLTLPKFIRDDGCIYPTTSLSRTVTGRSVMLNPAAQTFPARGKYARLFKEVVWAGEGWLLGSRDLSQSELRIMGWLAQDTNILDALERGIDLHTLTAARMNKITIDMVDKLMRFKAKGVNFGLIYGMSANGLMIYLRDEYDIHITIHEAETIRNLFFAAPNGYYGLPVFYDKITKNIERDGFTRTILGRKRRLPTVWSKDPGVRNEAIRQGINVQGQGPSSDFGLISMFLINDKIKKEKTLVNKVKPLWFIHDNILFRAMTKQMKPAMAILKHCMEEEIYDYVEENFGVTIGYPVKSDGKIGQVWSEMEEEG